MQSILNTTKRGTIFFTTMKSYVIRSNFFSIFPTFFSRRCDLQFRIMNFLSQNKQSSTRSRFQLEILFSTFDRKFSTGKYEKNFFWQFLSTTIYVASQQWRYFVRNFFFVVFFLLKLHSTTTFHIIRIKQLFIVQNQVFLRHLPDFLLSNPPHRNGGKTHGSEQYTSH